MQLESLQAFFDTSPAIRLLKSDHAPYVIDFLYRVFKGQTTAETVSFPQDELRTQLVLYQEERQEQSDKVLIGLADRYLTAWSDAGWLCRFLQSDSTQPHYQLTPAAEDAIRFVDSSLSQQSRMVGTESRLRLVIETLSDLVRGASADPDRRLKYLRQQRQHIDDEIAAIQAGQPVQVYQSAQVRERFQTALELLKTLQGDFRAVEDRFHQIAQQVQRETQCDSKNRGDILRDALDAEDLLKEQDEGISFYAFVSFLFSPDAQRKLRETIDEVTQLKALVNQDDALEHVRRMVPSLLVEADKVLQTTGRLSQTLRRLLDFESAQHRKRVAGVLAEIQVLATRVREPSEADKTVVLDDVGLSIDTSLGVASPISRMFWSPHPTFDNAGPKEHVIDLHKAQQAGRRLARLTRLDFGRMREAVRQATERTSHVTMAQLVDQHPPTAGVMELVGLLQLAHEDGHRIDRDTTEEIWVSCDTGEHVSRNTLRVIVPLVTFTRPTQHVRQRGPHEPF